MTSNKDSNNIQQGNKTNENNTTSKYGFDINYLRRFIYINKILFPTFLTKTVGWISVLIAFSAVEEFLSYRVGLISGQFYNALGSKDKAEFIEVTWQSLILITGITVTKSARVFASKMLGIAWRLRLTRELHKKYFSETTYYKLNVLGRSNVTRYLDNLDQRITADTNIFCTIYGSIITNLIVAPACIIYYTYDAYTRTGWIGPTAMYILFFVSSGVNKFLMSPVVNLMVKKERYEGDFRFQHVFIRVNSESLAFYGKDAETVEEKALDKKLEKLCNTQERMTGRQFILDCSTNMFDYIGGILSYMVIAIPIFAGVYDDLDEPALSQVISNTAFVCIYLAFNFSKFADMAGNISKMAGVTHRIGEVFEVKTGIIGSKQNLYEDGSSSETELSSDTSENNGILPSKTNTKENSYTPSALISFNDDRGYDQNDILSNESRQETMCSVRELDLYSPDGKRRLVKDLSFNIVQGKNLLITGKSCTGKTSLLRTLRGLWPAKSGVIEFPLLQDSIKSDQSQLSTNFIYYLPQKPFVSDNGSLRQLIAYPSKPNNSIEETQWIIDKLNRYGMSNLIERVGGSIDSLAGGETFATWTGELSPGEMQIISFLRLLYHHLLPRDNMKLQKDTSEEVVGGRIKLALLDESTSNISLDVEDLFYNECIQNGLTFVSVAHRDSIRKFHHFNLELGLENEKWKLSCIENTDNKSNSSTSLPA